MSENSENVQCFLKLTPSNVLFYSTNMKIFTLLSQRSKGTGKYSHSWRWNQIIEVLSLKQLLWHDSFIIKKGKWLINYLFNRFVLSNRQQLPNNLQHPFIQPSSQNWGHKLRRKQSEVWPSHKMDFHSCKQGWQTDKRLHLWEGPHVPSAPEAPSAVLCEHRWTAGFWQSPKSPWARRLWSTSRSAHNCACWQGTAPEKAHSEILKQTLSAKQAFIGH